MYQFSRQILQHIAVKLTHFLTPSNFSEMFAFPEPAGFCKGNCLVLTGTKGALKTACLPSLCFSCIVGATAPMDSPVASAPTAIRKAQSSANVFIAAFRASLSIL